VKPVVTVEEMKAIDADAPVPEEVLVGRAGAAVARAASRIMGSTYGRRVVTVAGKGNNGADGRVASERLRRAGARVLVLEAAEAPALLPGCDLVIDAAYGTGFRGEYRAPEPPRGAAVVAVDVPSGVSGDTGEAQGAPLRADATVTFAAYKPGLLLGEGPERAGDVEVADIGLDTSRARIRLVEDSDVPAALPRRPRESHKWMTAVSVVAGSPGMMGAAELSSRSAMRAGAGYVQLSVPGASPEHLPRGEVVSRALPSAGWEAEVLREMGRFRSAVVGPGLGRSNDVGASVRRLVAEADVPMVLDADGLFAVGGAAELAKLVSARRHPVVVTPHDGEFAGLAGAAPGPDRVRAASELAAAAQVVVLLKGPTTVVAEPAGMVLMCASGSPRLATAGTGDVLSGVIGAMMARGCGPLLAAGLGAHVHGRAAMWGMPEGLVSGDLPELVARWLSRQMGGGG
jgi:hydroxyethylthiazole kinase-like uncharacterized protein yjeF